jgi:hypothetical protein
MLKTIKNKAFIATVTFILGTSISSPVFGVAEIALIKRNPCLKNNNGIGNNHDIFVELPTNSQTLDDPENQITSIRIDPGNPGQMNKFTTDLAEQRFNTAEIEFVVSQVWDAEMRVKNTNLLCNAVSHVIKDYTAFSD